MELPQPNLYEIIGRKEVIINSLMKEIERLNAVIEEARKLVKDLEN